MSANKVLLKVLKVIGPVRVMNECKIKRIRIEHRGIMADNDTTLKYHVGICSLLVSDIL